MSCFQTCIISEAPQDHQMAKAFWQMVWQEDSRTIVMLTRTFEVIRIMCIQYWPLHLEKVETFGEFEITTVSEECFAHFTVIDLFFKKLINFLINARLKLDSSNKSSQRL